jgi:hypothetical protein
MPEPLLEPALLVSDNCTACHGTGDGTGETEGGRAALCTHCEGSGREVREMPVSAAFEMARQSYERLTAPPPSAVREQAIAEAGHGD